MYRVLIADDEMIERAVLHQTLEEKLGDRCVIFQAENGREALEIYERERIQIAILDIEMPGINGIAAAEKIREKDRDCCIIFLTAFDEFSYARKAITVRALDYLLKPYEEQELMLVLEEAMRLTDESVHRREAKQREQRRAGENSPTNHVSVNHAPTDQPSSEHLPEEDGLYSGAVSESRQEGAACGRRTDMLEMPEDSSNIRLSKVADMLYQYIRENYMYDISMQEVARVMNYSEAYFCKLFKQCFDKNFTSFLTEYRVNEAKKMLEEPTVNIKDIGKAVGYLDSNYFAKVFKRITGQSPTEYRMEIFQKNR